MLMFLTKQNFALNLKFFAGMSSIEQKADVSVLNTCGTPNQTGQLCPQTKIPDFLNVPESGELQIRRATVGENTTFVLKLLYHWNGLFDQAVLVDSDSYFDDLNEEQHYTHCCPTIRRIKINNTKELRNFMERERWDSSKRGILIFQNTAAFRDGFLLLTETLEHYNALAIIMTLSIFQGTFHKTYVWPACEYHKYTSKASQSLYDMPKLQITYPGLSITEKMEWKTLFQQHPALLPLPHELIELTLAYIPKGAYVSCAKCFNRLFER